jgi:hypothetical protein
MFQILEKIFPIQCDVSSGFVLNDLFNVEVYPYSTQLCKFFIMKACWILSKVVPTSVEMILWHFSFILLMYMLTKHPWIPGMNLTWPWWIMFLICHWIQLAGSFLIIYSIKVINVSFFLSLSLSLSLSLFSCQFLVLQ